MNTKQASKLICMQKAVQKILATCKTISGHEFVALEQARGRVLQQAIIASFSVPQHDNSAVDGYAISRQDIPKPQQTKRLKIVGVALAGRPYLATATTGCCVHIMTGVAVPAGFDLVISQEQAQRNGDTILIKHKHKIGQNIRPAGENIKQGQTLLAAGRLLMPADIGLIASLGIAEVSVRRKLRIAIASTGDEVKNLDANLGVGDIYDSNRYILMAILNQSQIEIISLGILADCPETLRSSFSQTAQHCDIIIASGGVSVGEADHTRLALETAGEIDFWKVAIKPGRPLAFGKIDECVFFGLPGNSVAVMVTFYQFVLPALEKILGMSQPTICPQFKATASESIQKKQGRTEIKRGIIKQNKSGQWQVSLAGQQGSGILRSMSLANAFIILEHDSTDVCAGEQVTVQAFSTLW